jgi:trimethylamine-N-oxide reductase (cytochrome c)
MFRGELMEIRTKCAKRETGPDLTRRGVLQAGMAAGLLGASGASLLGATLLGASRPANAADAAVASDGEVLTGSHWGAFRATVKGGRFVGIRPWEGDPQPAPTLSGVMDSVYSPTRIKYPMVRRAYLEQGPGADPAGRGDGDFVRVSWDRALDLVTKELQRVDKTYGPGGSFAGSYGWKSPGKLHNCQTLLRRMMSLKGGFVNSSGDYSTGAAEVMLPYVVGSQEVDQQTTAWPVVVDNTELMVFWGCDPINNNRIGWVIPDHYAYVGLAALKKKGTKVICIDPIRTETAIFLNAEWIAPRPQTDVTMLLGIAHTLYIEKLHDTAFLAKYSFGFDQFLPYLTGQADGVAKSAEWAETICEIPAAAIKALARRFAGNRTMLAAGWSLQRQQHGEQVHWMLITLAAMLGQIGTPGGGYGLSYHYGSGGSPAANSPVLVGMTTGTAAPSVPPWPPAGVADSIPVARITAMLENPGKPFDFNGTRANYPDVRLAYWVGGNPFAHNQDRNRMLKAWHHLETFIVHDFQWTATARHADIVLPCTSAYERNDIEQIGDYSLSHILAMKQVIAPVFEARNDYDIFADIATRLGHGDAFTQGRSEMDWIRAFYEAALVEARGKGIEMPVFDVFWNTDAPLAFPITSAGRDYIQHKDFRDDPLLNPLGTASGRIEIFSNDVANMHYDDCPPHPTWMEPVERLGGPTTKYPLHIDTKHPKFRLHSQLCGTSLRAAYAIAGREPCLISPSDAAKRGIKTGDIVRVFNDRGQILAGAHVTDTIRIGVICVNEGGWFDPENPRQPGSLDRYGDVNNLAIGIGTSKLAQGNCGHTAVGDVEKFQGTPPETDVFRAPGVSA